LYPNKTKEFNGGGLTVQNNSIYTINQNI